MPLRRIIHKSNELVFWTMAAVGMILVVYWFAYTRTHFTRPKAAQETARRRIEPAKGKGDD